MCPALTLDQKLKSLVQTERKITHEILLIIQTLDITRSYLELGFSSLFDYLVHGIGYSEGAAQRRISSARLMKQVPQIEENLKSGHLNLTQVSLAQVAIRQEEKAKSIKLSIESKKELIEKLKSKSSFETKKILKQELPSFEILTPQAQPGEQGKVYVTLKFDETNWGNIQNLMAHFSHSVPDQKLESLLLYWANQVLNKQQRQLEKLKDKIEKTQETDKAQEREKFQKKEKLKEQMEKTLEANEAQGTEKIKELIESPEIHKTQLFGNSQEREVARKKKKNQILEKFKEEVNKAQGSEKPLGIEEIHENRKIREIDKLPGKEEGQSVEENRQHTPQFEWTQGALVNTPQQSLQSSSPPSMPLRRWRRKSLSVAMKIHVQKVAEGQCQYISTLNGQRCTSKHFLEYEHIVPVSKGGANDFDNLRMYCRSHNFLMAKKWGLLCE